MKSNKEETIHSILKGMSSSDLSDIAQVGIKSDNLTIIKLVAKTKSSTLKSLAQSADKEERIFDACKFASYPTFEFLERNAFNFKHRSSTTLNTCQHQAAIYGNLGLLEDLVKKRRNEFDLNAQNLQLDTPLHSALKFGLFRYEKTTMFLSRFTDLTLRDNEGKEPHRIRMKNLKQNVRLSEFLTEKYLKFKLRQSANQ